MAERPVIVDPAGDVYPEPPHPPAPVVAPTDPWIAKPGKPYRR